MAFKTKKTEAITNVCISSVGVCLATSEDKKKPSCLVVAYKVEEKIKFVATAYPVNKEYDRDSILAIVGKAENAKEVTYNTMDGFLKDIYVCRADKGKIVDFVPRDYAQNRYVDGFIEILASNLKFKVKEGVDDFQKKFDKPMEFTFSTFGSNGYVAGSYEYAIANAYNACLLGGVFDREEFQLETKGKKRVKAEVRSYESEFFEQEILCVKPHFSDEDDLVDYYVTEEFQRISPEDVYTQTGKGVYSYKISYIESFKDYNLTRNNTRIR